MSKSKKKPSKKSLARKVYKRNTVVHICHRGFLYAPRAHVDTEVRVGGFVTKVTDIDPCTVEVFQPRCKAKGIKETWVMVEVPKIPRKKKTYEPPPEAELEAPGFDIPVPDEEGVAA